MDEFNTFGDESRCGSTCSSDPNCNYYTFFSDSGNCLLYSTCELAEDQCEGCATSEKECFTQGQPVQGDLLVVVKSYTQPELSVIDLANPGRVCNSESIGPLAQIRNPQSLHGTFVGGDLFVCGDTKDDCFRFDDATLEWTRDENGGRAQDRFLAYGVDMENGVHWVTAGDDGGFTYTSEVFDGEVFADGIGLPVATRDHCMVRLSDTEAMLVSGEKLRTLN